MTPEKQGAGMRSMARDQSHKRKWSRQTPYTTMMSARVPTWLADKVRDFVDYTDSSVSDVIVVALDEFIKHHSPLETAGGKEDEGAD